VPPDGTGEGRTDVIGGDGERQLREDVARICPPFGRMVGSDGHRHAREYLAGRMREIGLVPYRGSSFGMAYRDAERKFFNLVGVVPCGDGRRPPVLIGAHYDSVIDAPCADDNAAAVAIALAAAASLMGRKLDRDVVVALFDAEEPPYFHGESMGSTRFHREQMLPEGTHAAVIMDLVGHDVRLPIANVDELRPGVADLIILTGAESHPELAGVVARQDFAGLVPIATLNRNIGDMSDHHVFRTNGVPYLFLSCGRWEHYHQPGDTPDRLNYAKMARISALLVGLVAALASAPLVRPPEAAGVPVVCDTAALELRLFREALGPFLPKLLAKLELEKLETREDLDALAVALQWLI
jgi:hypothetical protein